MLDQSFLKSEVKAMKLWIKQFTKAHQWHMKEETIGQYLIEQKYLITVFKLIVPEKQHQNHFLIPLDFILNTDKQKKINMFIESKLLKTKMLFARNSTISLIKKQEAFDFCEKYHLIGGLTGAYAYGLFFKEKLVAVAIFSKGRKMHRLAAHQRSFELMRFVCESGLTITGGLSKLMQYFINDKQPGDIMTYVDKQFYTGQGFQKIGFEYMGETLPNTFLIDSDYRRYPLKSKASIIEKIYETSNAGNFKLILTNHKK
jgi:hypothetical protein